MTDKNIKTTYRYTEEQCKSFDNILEDIHNSESLYTVKNIRVDNMTNRAIRIIVQAGFTVDYKEMGNDSISFKLSPSGAEFFRNGGFLGERQRNIAYFMTENSR